jgi:hypothetical protein
MTYDPVKLTAKKSRTRTIESYFPSIAEMRNDMLEEKNISGPVLEVATLLSTPALNQRGTKIMPPPILTQAPSTPATNPFSIPYLILLSDIF